MCPIFQISNVTGENMDLLKMFLNLLSSRTAYRDDQPAEFQIDDTYSVPVPTNNDSHVWGFQTPMEDIKTIPTTPETGFFLFDRVLAQ